MGDFWRGLGNILSFGQTNRNDRKREKAERDAATEAWQALQGQMPSAYDLQGLGLFSGQAPQDYVDDYIAARAPTMIGSPAGYTDALTQQAQQQWVQEQLAQDPLFGLNVADQSQLAGVQADPRMVEAQMQALTQMAGGIGRLQGVADAGGYTASQRQQLRLSQQNAAQAEQAQRAAALQQAQMRGMNAGGASLMGALSAQQGAANRSADFASQIGIAGQERAMQAQLNALQAIQQRGAMAGNVRAQGFNEASQRASAADAWNQYRTGLTQQRQQQAGQAAQNAFANQMNVTAGLTGQYNANAGAYQQDQDNTNAGVTDIARTVGDVYTGGAASAAGAAVGGQKGRR